mmetsp:Transcript_71472/g.206928  ORF Transcript_71472/g.206928 Transcript_71472/m.206928 type:complete len:85 (+) Transcript_71472:32-286(+)
MLRPHRCWSTTSPRALSATSMRTRRPTRSGPTRSRTCEALKSRLDKYYAQTTPVLEHYQSKGIVSHINADQAPDKVWADTEPHL